MSSLFHPAGYHSPKLRVAIQPLHCLTRSKLLHRWVRPAPSSAGNCRKVAQTVGCRPVVLGRLLARSQLLKILQAAAAVHLFPSCITSELLFRVVSQNMLAVSLRCVVWSLSPATSGSSCLGNLHGEWVASCQRFGEDSRTVDIFCEGVPKCTRGSLRITTGCLRVGTGRAARR